VPPNVCGEGALTLLFEPSITVLVKGVVPLEPPTVSCRPTGALSKLSTTVFGSSRNVFVSVRPPASVAVRRSSR
jgi:hypothetical protein